MKSLALWMYILIGIGAGVSAPDSVCGSPVSPMVKFLGGALWPAFIGARLADAHGEDGMGYKSICKTEEQQ